MNRAYRFDLENAIASWRRTLVYNRAFLVEDLDELERHVRDQISALVNDGMAEKEALERALEEMGDYGSVEAEYNKVYWHKLKRTHQIKHEVLWRLTMLMNYFKIALRNFKKQTGYAFINIFGLAVGLASFILILLFVQHELSYDRFLDHSDRIYRVVQWKPGADYLGSDYFAVTPPPLASTLVRDYPEVTHATSIRNREVVFRLKDLSFRENGIWASEQFFEVLPFPLLQGDPATALAEPNTIVLTASLAQKFFGDQDPMGQTILGFQTPYTVTGIIPDVPANTSIPFTFVMSFVSLRQQFAQRVEENIWDAGSGHLPWDPGNVYTYFVLAEGVSPAHFEAKLPDLVAAYVFGGNQEAAREDQRTYLIQALHDIHLRSHFNFEHAQTGDITYVYLFLGLAFLILLLACVNYMNLTVARSIKRAREVGMRKVVGARRGQLLGQFLGESVLMTFLALVLALGLVHLLLPLFGHLVQRPLVMDYLGNALLMPGLVMLILLVGLFSGAYPAFFLASLRPLGILKGRVGGSPSRTRLQRFLIVGQFTASIALIACGAIIYQQLQYVQNKDVGYDREHVLTIPMLGPEVRERYDALRTAWTAHTQITAVTTAHALPTNIDWSEKITGWQGSAQGDSLAVYVQGVNYDYLKVLGMALVAGRTFSRAVPTDAEGALINETAAQALGWTPEEAIGQPFTREAQGDRTIIGVMKDIHIHSLHQEIAPFVLYLNDYALGSLYVKVRAERLPETVAFLAERFRAFSPYPFEYQFLDTHFDQLYTDEHLLGKTLGFFTLLALLLASLGLLGLATYAAEQRTKEIGVRKVLGASVSSLILMLSKDFTMLVMVAAVVATPIAYFAMHRWLEGFAYRVEISWEIFFLAGLAALGLALITVSYQAIKAALADPVKSLRYE